MLSRGVGNLHSVALIDLILVTQLWDAGWEPSFCSLDRLTVPQNYLG